MGVIVKPSAYSTKQWSARIVEIHATVIDRIRSYLTIFGIADMVNYFRTVINPLFAMGIVILQS